MGHVFLSESWMKAARDLYDEYAGKLAPVQHEVKVNLLVNDSPFELREVEVHFDTTSGALIVEPGHVDGADLFVTVDYNTAKALLIDGNPQAAMQAFLLNKIRVEGDISKLMVLAQAPMGDDAVEYAQALRDLTE
ncbi:MAG: SCP2 sterol-binding domain-containing protein [Actinomycetota bacterium]